MKLSEITKRMRDLIIEGYPHDLAYRIVMENQADTLSVSAAQDIIWEHIKEQVDGPQIGAAIASEVMLVKDKDPRKYSDGSGRRQPSKLSGLEKCVQDAKLMAMEEKMEALSKKLERDEKEYAAVLKWISSAIKNGKESFQCKIMLKGIVHRLIREGFQVSNCGTWKDSYFADITVSGWEVSEGGSK